MGSVAEAVSRHCGCSVLVVRRKSHDKPVLELEAPCGVCAEARVKSQGGQLWCHDHVEQHERRFAFYDRGSLGARQPHALRAKSARSLQRE
jgi:hypothetical protein